tara:strand:+ start:503 stop:676 length:174 start_codon:yes stop_codon:yes gene_type:complete
MSVRKIKKVAGQLAKASKLHGRQAKTIMQHADSMAKMSQGGFTRKGPLKKSSKNPKY